MIHLNSATLSLLNVARSLHLVDVNKVEQSEELNCVCVYVGNCFSYFALN